MTQRPPIDDVGPEHFLQARTVFEAALDRPAPERAAFIEDACRGDAALLSVVREMLRADSEPHPLLDGGPSDTPNRWHSGDVVGGHFHVVSLLGRGGMGEVYRARDATLVRDVALKVLPIAPGAAATLDSRLARFQREAEVLAALNHANIAAIFGVVDDGDARALVLELVEGPTLADRLAAGPIPLDEVVGIARQIAAGLEAAHEQGIVHRDLKPSNIALRPDGTVKLLDFGLAKVVQPEATAGEGMVSRSPDITGETVRHGVIFGSAPYMSPEQAKGRDADRRSDVWAFGAVLYELTAGRRAFAGEDVPDTLAAVLHADVDGSRLPPSTPAALRQLISRCLDRNVMRRLRDIGEARVALEDLSLVSAPVPALTDERMSRGGVLRRAVGPAIAAAVGAAAVAIVLWPDRAPSAPPITRFVLSMPAEQTLLLDPQSRDLAITPDGTRVIYKGGARVDGTQLFAYPLDQLEPQPILAPGLPKGPFASPDGRWIGFFEPGGEGAALKKVPVSGGPPVDVSRLDGPSRGATWGDDDTIIAASGHPSTGLLRIPAGGGAFSVLTRPDRAHGEGDHLYPEFLPGGKAVLFTIAALNGDLHAARVAVLDLATGTAKTIIRGGSQAQYVRDGRLIYAARGALWAIAFDPARFETIGAPKVVVPQVVTLPTGVAEFDIARDGTLVYVAKGGTSDAPRTLAWVDRQGRETPIAAPPRPYTQLRLSPDGTRVALESADAEHDVWVWDFARETLTRVTTDPGLDGSPAWTPDGRRLVFTSQAGGMLGALYWQAADGSGVAERLCESPRTQRASTVLADGSAVLFSEGAGILALDLDTGRRVRTVLEVPQRAGSAVVSRDRRWLAYVARDPGASPNVFVSPFADPGTGRTLVSPAGGSQPRWSPDGRELFFTAVDGALMRAPVVAGPAFAVGTPAPVFRQRYFVGLSLLERPGTYDVSPDGQRFLVLKQGSGPDQPTEPATVVVVKNWIEDLRRLVPTTRQFAEP